MPIDFVDQFPVFAPPVEPPFYIYSTFGDARWEDNIRIHQAVDVFRANAAGDVRNCGDIFAVREGEVVRTHDSRPPPTPADPNPPHDWLLWIRHDDFGGHCFLTGYYHLTSLNVAVGDIVREGQAIGRHGVDPAENHLHFAVTEKTFVRRTSGAPYRNPQNARYMEWIDPAPFLYRSLMNYFFSESDVSPAVGDPGRITGLSLRIEDELHCCLEIVQSDDVFVTPIFDDTRDINSGLSSMLTLAYFRRAVIRISSINTRFMRGHLRNYVTGITTV